MAAHSKSRSRGGALAGSRGELWPGPARTSLAVPHPCARCEREARAQTRLWGWRERSRAREPPPACVGCLHRNGTSWGGGLGGTRAAGLAAQHAGGRGITPTSPPPPLGRVAALSRRLQPTPPPWPLPPQTQVPRGGHLGGSFMPGATSGLAVARTGGCAFQPAWRRPAHLQSLCSPVVGGGRGHGAVRGTTEGWWQWQTAGGTFTVAAAPPRAHSAGPRAPPSILFLRSPSGLPPAPFPSSTPPPTHAHSNGSRLAPAAAVRRGGDAPRLQALCLLHGALPAASREVRGFSVGRGGA